MCGPWTNCFLLRHCAMISEILGTTRMPNRQIAAIVSSLLMKSPNITLRRRERPTELEIDDWGDSSSVGTRLADRHELLNPVASRHFADENVSFGVYRDQSSGFEVSLDPPSAASSSREFCG